MRTKRIGLVVSPHEKNIVLKLAELEGRSMASTIRKLIREEGRRRGLWQQLPQPQEVEPCVR